MGSLKKLKSVFGLACFFLPQMSDARALEQLHQFSTQIKSAHGEFIQQVMRQGKSPQQSSGEFSFLRPGKFRWFYRQPFEQLLVADGTKLYIYDKDLNQVTIRKLNHALESSPAAILFGTQALEKVYQLADLGQRENMEWVEARPKNKDSTFEKILIGLRDGQPQVMELFDNFGQTTLLKFTKLTRNSTLLTDQFRFVIPKGADVLEQ